MAKKKQWYIYDPYSPALSIEQAAAISNKPLPKRRDDYKCARMVNRGTPRLRIGKTYNLVFGDPRLLEKCVFLERGISRMPKYLARKAVWRGDKWWTFRWNGGLLFVYSGEIALAKEAKKEE